MTSNQLYTIVLIAFLLLTNKVYGQLIQNDLNIYVGYSTGTFHGNQLTGDGGFKYPSFYNNLRSLTGFNSYFTYNIYKHFSIGLSVDNIVGSNWKFGEREEYTGGIVTLLSASPLILYHNQFKENGIFNRLKFNLGVAPNFGKTTVKLVNDLFEVQNKISEVETMNSIQSNYFGLRGLISIVYHINQQFGLYSSYNISHNWIDSPLNADKKLICSQIVFGGCMRFLKNKRYFY